MAARKLKYIHSLKDKFILLFIILIVFTAAGISVCANSIYKAASFNRLKAYIGDTNKQTSINVQSYIDNMNDITFNILSNSIIQDRLAEVNKGIGTEYRNMNIRKDIILEIEKYALYNSNIFSLSVISVNGIEYTVQKISGREIIMSSTLDSIEKANGGSVWKMDAASGYICNSRAILSLSTMKVIGYVNLVCEKTYFEDILKDISMIYSNGCFLIDANGLIVSANNSSYIGKSLHMSQYNWNFKKNTMEINGEPAFYYIGNSLNNGWKIVTTIPASELYDDTDRFGLSVLIISCAAIILSVCAAILITYKITKPTEALLQSMNNFGRGDLKERVSINTKDEIGEISEVYNRMADNIETLVDKIFAMEIMQKQAEIEVLKMQMNPHFLYNTLDAISWTAMLAGNDDVSEMAIILGNLLRANIKNDSFITIEEELNTIRDYLTIQKYRFGDKIQVMYFVNGEVLQFVMPNFILQPIVENAIIHGLEPKIDYGKLEISIFKSENTINFIIKDNGVGMNQYDIDELYRKCESEQDNNSVGLQNVYRRLKLYYGEDVRFLIESEKGKNTQISFTIPTELIHRQHFIRKKYKDI